MTAESEIIARRTPIGLRFSLLALLIFVTLVCLLLAWAVQPNRVVATSLFRVSSSPPRILDEASAALSDPNEFEIFKKTQVAMIRSYFVLNAAVRKPGVAKLSILKDKDPVEFLEQNLDVEFPGDAEIMQISLRGRADQSADLVKIVDAVSKAYSDEVIYKDRQRDLTARDILARTWENLNREIDHDRDDQDDGETISSEARTALRELNLNRLDRVESELMRLENEQLQSQTSGAGKDEKFYETRIAELRQRQAELEKAILAASASPAGLNSQKAELDLLQRLANEIGRKLQIADIESRAPGRVELLQTAVPSPD